MREVMFCLAFLATLSLTACGPTSDAAPPSNAVAPVSVQVTRVERGDMIRSIRLSASVEAFETPAKGRPRAEQNPAGARGDHAAATR